MVEMRAFKNAGMRAGSIPFDFSRSIRSHLKSSILMDYTTKILGRERLKRG
jgi:hypothetical protein